jgi:hypothetical protein
MEDGKLKIENIKWNMENLFAFLPWSFPDDLAKLPYFFLQMPPVINL